MGSEETNSGTRRLRDAHRRDLRRQRRGRVGVWPVLWASLVGMLIFLGFLSVSGQSVALPGWITRGVESRLDAALPDLGLRLGRIEVLMDDDGRPRLRLRNVAITDAGGNRIAELNRLGASLSPAALMRGEIAPSVLRLSGAEITVRRDSEGDFTLDFGGAGTPSVAGNLGVLLDAIDAAFARPPLAGLERIEATDVTISLEDARSGRVWQATGGRLSVQNLADAVSITVFSEVFNGTEDLADVQLSFRSNKGSPAAGFGVSFENAAARDIALQSPALAYLALLEAPISGSMRANVGSDGKVERLAATLEIGSGSLRPAREARPIAFDSARTYLTYRPATGRIEFSEISARSETLVVSATGQAYLAGTETGWPQSILGQLQLSDVELRAADLYAEPLRFEEGHADLRLGIDPFSLELAEVALVHQGARATIGGTIGAGVAGWSVDLDLSSERIAPEALLGLWPERAAENARAWVAENVLGGSIADLDASVRLHPGKLPIAGFDFAFENAVVRALKHFPSIEAGTGRASLVANRFSLELDAGEMRAEDGRSADLAGSRFTIADVTQRAAPTELDLAASGDLPTILSLMENRPFEVLSKAGRPADFASAEARVTADVAFPLKKKIQLEDVDFRVEGALFDVASDAIVPGRSLSADTLTLSVTPTTLAISGPASLDDVPVTATWTRPLGRDAAPGSRVRASVDLTEASLARFGVVLPPGTVRGKARAEAELDILPGAPVAFRLSSDLRGATLSLPQIGWEKPAATAGVLVVEGEAREGSAIASLLRIDAPGLAAEGTVAPGEAAGSTVVAFSRVRAGDWLDAPVTLTTRGPGRSPDIRISGGSIDLRERPEVEATGGGGSPLRVNLDRLQITDAIALAPFRAELATAGGLSGGFTGNVNGESPVRGTVVPSSNGTAIRVLSDNAGLAIRDAGIIRNGRGGDMDLILVPKAEPGSYEGKLKISEIRLRDAPILAGLLDAISIVGIIDQLRGPGIVFDTVESTFDLTPERIVIREGSAVGASLGISLDGTYEPATQKMELQGVISPIYLVNGIGQIFTRRGEGLFGFTYRVEGEGGRSTVSVNPFSILTPGIFREIFRRPPPEPPQ